MNKINARQNEKEMLKYQFAARVYYNRAELLSYLIWFLCLISAACVFISINTSWFQWIPLIADLMAVLLGLTLSHTLSNAASFRSYFDAYVLNIGIESFEDNDLRKLKERSSKLIHTKRKYYHVQITNTGNDTPPGVRDWYDIPTSYSERDAQYECQKQNCWWNKKMADKRCLINIMFVIFAVVVAVFAIRNVSMGNGIMIGILGSGGIITRCIERVLANKEYRDLSLKIDGASETLSDSRDMKNLCKLQDFINKRRKLPVLEINFIHKRIAFELSKMYHDFLP
ncbi:MAG: S-4TM family putative pore-forming effector [Lachnospiraceae bacterium]